MRIIDPAIDVHADLYMGSVFEINETIEATMVRLGVEVPTIVWGWNGRMSSGMGYAEYDEMRISLSKPLWPNATERQRKHTVVHETVHLAVFAKYGSSALKRHHGDEWKSMMIDVGESPLRCHTVSRKGVVPSITGICSCKEHTITSRKSILAAHRAGLVCKSCGSKLAFEMNAFA